MAIITISREFGAGGRTLGTRVAEALGYNLVDEDIIERVAREANVSPNWVKSIEREAGGRLLRYISGLGPFRKPYLERLTEKQGGYIDGHIYVQLLHKIITQIAEEGNAIIIGRGGQYILRDFPDTFHLLLVADYPNRVRFMEKNYNLSNRQATIIVDKQSKRRMNLYRYFGREDYDQPTLYHLVLNTSKISIDEGVAVASGLVKAKQG